MRADYPLATKPPAEPIRVAPCPFCAGPPVVSCDLDFKDVPIPDEGLMVDAYVWCHECGARGPRVDALIDEKDELWGLKTRAAELWNLRDFRHHGCYSRDERSLFPRPNQKRSLV